MSIERDGFDGPISFCCDNCGEVEETRCAEFSGALAKSQAHGWRAAKVGDEWEHTCPDCSRRSA
jgi:Fe2+ or Zn2+ uptake regulation protein